MIVILMEESRRSEKRCCLLMDSVGVGGWLMYMYHIMRLPLYISTPELSNFTFDLCFIFTSIPNF